MRRIRWIGSRTLDAADLDLPGVTTPSATPPPVSRDGERGGDLRLALDNYQRQLIGQCLERHQHNWASAARELGLDRANLSRLARRLGLR